MASSLRKRGVHKTSADSSNDASGDSPIVRLAKFDLYPKYEEEFRIKTNTGGALSLATFVVLFILCCSEFHAYRTTTTSDHIRVDTTVGERMKINMNITFTHLPCSEIEPVAMDVAGEHQLEFSHHIHKTRLEEGTLLPIAEGRHKVEINAPAAAATPEPLPADYCGSCFGAGETDSSCCNNCAELKAAYVAKGWSTQDLQNTADQCKREASDPFAESQAGEGCRIDGHMTVNKVGGNFHVALGKTKSVHGRLIHQFSADNLETFNPGHIIHTLSFGEPFPGQKNPLDGNHVEVKEEWMKTAAFQYFVKIVPTNFTDVSRAEKSFTSYQYSFTQKVIPIGDGADGMHKAAPGVKLPGLFMVYEISPFMVQSTVRSVPFTHFLTQLCAIIGGVFTVSGIIDSVLYNAGAKSNKRGLL